MYETAGSLAIVHPVVTLAFLIGLPLLWTAICTLLARPADRKTPGLGGPIVALTGAVGLLVLALVLSARVALLPHGTILVQHVAQLGRLGQLDLAFDLALDPRSVTFVVVIAVVALAAVLNICWSHRKGGSARLAWTGLAVTGALLLCIGDGFAPILVGLGILSIGGWGVARGGEPAANTSILAGNVSVFFGFVFLFWSLGGQFGAEGYDPDGAPRFVLVTTPGPNGAPTKATLTMTSHAGALVSSDDADLPGEPIAAPFSIEVDPGVHTLRVQGGAASGDVVVPRVALVAGKSHVLTPYGPTTSLRVLDDQIGVPRVTPAGGGFVNVRLVLAGRTIGGLRASAIILLLVVGGALAHAHALASLRGHSPIALTLLAVPAPYLALRFAALVDPFGADGALVVVLGAGSAFVLGARASCVDDGHRALRGVLAATAAAAVASVGLGEATGALVLTCAAIVACVASFAAIDARSDVRWLGVAAAASVGLFPGAGASMGFILAIAAALGTAASGGASAALFGGVVAVALVATVLSCALAAFRVYDAILNAAAGKPATARRQEALLVVGLAILALAGGAVLGVGSAPFGGAAVPLARRMAGPNMAPMAPKALAFVAAVLAILAAAGGVILARRASAAVRPPRWLLSFGRPYGLLDSAAHTLAEAATFLHRSVRAMDRDVIEDIPAAIRSLAGSSRTKTPAAEGGGAFVTALLAVLVALLLALVASAFLLR